MANPELIGGLIGYASGQTGYLLTGLAVRRNRQATVGAHNRVKRHNRLSVLHVGNVALSTMAGLATAAGFSFGAAAAKPKMPPKGKEVVSVLQSHTRPAQRDGAIVPLNKAAEVFAKTGKVSARLLLENNNNTPPTAVTSITELKNTTPYGVSQLKSNIKDAMSDSYAAAPRGSSNVPGTSADARSAATVLLIDGANESLSQSDIQEIVNLSHEQGGQPLYIGTTAPSSSLEVLANSTGGHYYNIGQDNAAEVAQKMLADAHPHEISTPMPPSQNGDLLALGIGLTVLTGAFAVRRATGMETGEGKVI